jgi:hypothetical protein
VQPNVVKTGLAQSSDIITEVTWIWANTGFGNGANKQEEKIFNLCWAKPNYLAFEG